MGGAAGRMLPCRYAPEDSDVHRIDPDGKEYE